MLTGAGHYLVTIAKRSTLSFYDEAVLSGPRVQETSPFCKLTLWLFVDDETDTNVDVHFRNASAPASDRGVILARIKKYLGGQWIRHEVSHAFY